MIVCFVYRVLPHRTQGCSAIYDLLILLYINHSVYLQRSENLQPVSISGVQTQTVNVFITHRREATEKVQDGFTFFWQPTVDTGNSFQIAFLSDPTSFLVLTAVKHFPCSDSNVLNTSGTRQTGTKPARTSLSSASDCTGVWMLPWEGRRAVLGKLPASGKRKGGTFMHFIWPGLSLHVGPAVARALKPSHPTQTPPSLHLTGRITWMKV